MEAKHTATPWALNEGEIPPILYAANGDGKETCIALFDGDEAYAFPNVATCEANAAFILRACNAHDDLVKALNDIIYASTDEEEYLAIEMGRAALAKAGA